MKKIVLLLAISVPLFAQEAKDDETIVSVPKKYVSSEGLVHQSDTNKWIGVGREIGQATHEGLNAVVDTAEKFGTTKIGTFVMVMIAWRIMAKDLLHIVLGIPFLLGGICVWFYLARRLVFGYRVLDRKEGNTKFYKEHPPYNFDSSEAKGFVGALLTVGLIGFIAIMLAVIFS